MEHNCPGECWKPVREYAEYEISCRGRMRTWKTANGRGNPPSEPHMLAQRRKDNGYYEVTLNMSNGTMRSQRPKVYPHREALLAFKGKPLYPAMCSAHIDGDRGHNILSNLEWATRKQLDEYRKGRVVG